MSLISTTDTIVTTDLATTTLADLNAAASLLTRVDRKYLLPTHDAQDLVYALAGRAQVLQIGGRRSFAYASTYFDTPALDSYYLAARGRRRRFKVRTRSYLDSGLTFLEVKTRGGRHATVKCRMEYDHMDLITDRGQRFVAEQLVGSGTCSAERAAEVAATLVPVLSTTYERVTLHLPDDDARATIDTALTWSHPSAATGESGESCRATGYAVVETKNPATPSPTDHLLWAAGFRPTKISKYATGMALLHPRLPANKWHRVLHRELAHAEPRWRGSRASVRRPPVRPAMAAARPAMTTRSAMAVRPAMTG